MSWRSTAKTAAITATVTSAFWVIAGAVWFQRALPDTVMVAASPAGPGQSAGTARRGPTSTVPPTVALARRRNAALVVPVSGVRPEQLIDTFTAARSGGRIHDAIDIMAPLGTPVVAAAAGTVEKLFYSVRGGKTIYVRSPDRALIYYYAHLDRYAPSLAEKRVVRQGEVLGTVGYTGDADPSAPHLHFELQQTTPQSNWWQHQANLNPFPLLGGR